MALLVVSNREVSNANYFPNPESLQNFLGQHGKDIDTLLFAFWGWIVEPWMLEKYKCYGMHTGPLLEGRGKGGSPIDNLKKLGVRWTTLCAFEMTEKLDEGRVKVAIPLNISYPKADIIQMINGYIPYIIGYLTEKVVDVPIKFKRLKDAK